MDDPKESVYIWLTDERNRTMLLFALAAGLGLTSLLFFFAGSSNSPSRAEFALIVAAMVVVFYTTLRTNVY
ncbi:hypothetical protein M0R89_13685 [Halorussus limi]|uniref:Uncharacterized protein n=1 Tax=Halorussus limi TaxID=2938695 RepID=A0A8U0HSA2_9EURY|nr:hypothetical protein [Halorussus limi]UPV73586.1 hypothetical protein M0R89_13685 [Halorussus limi]